MWVFTDLLHSNYTHQLLQRTLFIRINDSKCVFFSSSQFIFWFIVAHSTDEFIRDIAYFLPAHQPQLHIWKKWNKTVKVDSCMCICSLADSCEFLMLFLHIFPFIKRQRKTTAECKWNAKLWLWLLSLKLTLLHSVSVFSKFICSIKPFSKPQKNRRQLVISLVWNVFKSYIDVSKMYSRRSQKECTSTRKSCGWKSTCAVEICKQGELENWAMLLKAPNMKSLIEFHVKTKHQNDASFLVFVVVVQFKQQWLTNQPFRKVISVKYMCVAHAQC